MKILIIGPSWVGDMVMSQCLYISLKQRHPEAEIDVLAPAWCRPILERMPEVHRAIEMPIGHGEFNLMGRYRIGKSLRETGYDQAIIMPNSAKSALIPLFARIPVRIGWKGESRYGLLTDLRSNKRDFGLVIERYSALAYPKAEMTSSAALPPLAKPTLTIDLNNQAAAMSRLSLSLDRPVVGLCPGAEFGPAKRWPEEYFAQVAQQMIEQGKQVWLFGSAKDQPVTAAIKNALPGELQSYCHDLAGQTSLIEAVDLLAACHTVVSNDSGLMHVAAAVGCKIVAIYGSTSPDYTPPLAEEVAIIHTDIECRPCFKRECPYGHLKCLKELPAERVIQAIDTLSANH
ncbi:lipopolysaccharide heptosyltransferase II [Photobacterium galatheae]|uniref:lipopolysaccharide heptosyltransferase II n=1 Tax=Photobacterium galatheae TaxID=1654360 RepID=A0A066RNK3_9GAMM|nr:lipopolysaccharide heptosyltransferase II [Photobacterium galatheae]KDM90656.1 ADP-heptose--LPS heptosyltransferase [Photobacterium galatheae]MCM0150648.1 lipopolysaccharide heptosyltransferase II [Photobacterium galatheae]